VTHEKAICAISCSRFDFNEVFWFGFNPNEIQVAKTDKQSGQVAVGVSIDDVGCLGLIPRGHITVIGVDCHQVADCTSPIPWAEMRLEGVQKYFIHLQSFMSKLLY
jgi:hypothetical protein